MKAGSSVASHLIDTGIINKANDHQDTINCIKDKISKLNTFEAVHLIKLIRCIAFVAINNKPGFFYSNPKIEIMDGKLAAFVQKISPDFTVDEAKFLTDQFIPKLTLFGVVEYEENLKALFHPWFAAKLSHIGSLSINTVRAYLAFVGVISRRAFILSISDDKDETVHALANKRAIEHGVDLDNNTIVLPKINIDDLLDVYEHLFRVPALDYTDFTNAKISHCTLNGKNMSNSVMKSVGFSSVRMKEVNLFNSDLSHARLSHVDLENAQLKKVNMSYARFYDVGMKRVDLTEANMSNMILVNNELADDRFLKYTCDNSMIHAILIKVNMSHATMKNINCYAGNFLEANLSSMTMYNMSFTVAYMANINMSNSTMKNVSFNRTNLANTNLSNSTMTSVSFKGTNLINTNLSNSTMTDVSFIDADVTNMNLSNSTINNLNFYRLNLRLANLDNVKITIKFNKDLDRDFNYINNPSGSILTAIDLIDDKYKELKLNLMLQVIAHLWQENVLSIIPVLTDFFGKRPTYLDNEQISHFVIHWIGLPLQAQTTKLNQLPDSILKCFMAAIKSLNNSSQLPNPLHWYMREHNNFFVQLYYWSQKSLSAEVKNIGNELWVEYLTLAGVAPVKEHYENVMMQWEDGDTLIFINKADALVVPSLYLDRNIHSKKLADLEEIASDNSDWNNCSYYHNKVYQVMNRGLANSRPELHKIFESFSIFQNSYAFGMGKATFGRLINILNLGDLKEHFIKAISCRFYSVKMVGTHFQNKVTDIFQAFIDGGAEKVVCTGVNALDISLTTSHAKAILFLYQIEDNNERQALLFLCLAAVFARYSSTLIFGIEGDSPTAVRNYALALLNKTIELAPDLVEPNILANWKERFTGIVFSCSGTISAEMISCCKKKAPDLFNPIVPPAWS